MGERFVCVYILTGEERWLMVDTGLADTPSRFVKPYLEQYKLAPQAPPYVLVTHADNDHFGGNAPVKQLYPDSTLLCHILDQAMIEDVELLIRERYDEWATGHNLPLNEEAKSWVRDTTEAAPVEILLQGGEQLRLGPRWGVALLHTPGHSRGHLSVYDAGRQIAIIGDAALWISVPDKDGNPVLPPTYRYVDSYKATLNRLLQLPISLLLTGHYRPYRDQDVAMFLLESLAYVERVERALARTLQEAASGRTLRQLIQELSPKLGAWPDAVAHFLAHPLSGHLERMVRLGKVESYPQNGLITYRWHE
jgi:glyoxylase-like metal-dependent hydrolase (beta-lactamase superfamily II)